MASDRRAMSVAVRKVGFPHTFVDGELVEQLHTDAIFDEEKH